MRLATKRERLETMHKEYVKWRDDFSTLIDFLGDITEKHAKRKQHPDEAKFISELDSIFDSLLEIYGEDCFFDEVNSDEDNE